MMKHRSPLLGACTMLLLATGILSVGFTVARGKDPPKPAVPKNAVPTEKATKPMPATVPVAPKTTAAETAHSDSKESAESPKQRPAGQEADEDAIRTTGDEFVEAYSNGDAKALSAMFTADAEYIDEQGTITQGRDGIEKILKTCFEASPRSDLEMSIHSIRFITSAVAVEDGTTIVTRSEDSDPITTAYTAIHVKADGKWLTASVREHAPKDRRQHRTMLRQLSWLHGEWVDENHESVVYFSCSPAEGGKFLDRSFSIHMEGHEPMSGTQRIGWDPLTGKLRTWIFDSEGGYGEGFWHRDQDRWILKATGVTADGQSSSSTSIYTIVNENTMTWHSVDHEIGGVELPDSDVVTIIRRATPPESHESHLPVSK